LISRNLALGIAMITIAVAAVAAEAGQQQSPVVLVKYVVGENSPDFVEKVLTGPIERTLRSLRRVTDLRSTTGNSGTGVTVAVEISFEGGATSLDLNTVLKRVSQLETKGNVEFTSITVQLLQPHEHSDVRSLQR
jgi:Cu/Ag efflux pump CusA